MGKRIDDLHALNDTPIRDDDDDRDAPWRAFLRTVEGLLETGEYDWAFDSLDGMRQTVEHFRRVTDGQQRALDNIERAGRGGRDQSRRYEGYRGRR
jgi:hypothetical protein